MATNGFAGQAWLTLTTRVALPWYAVAEDTEHGADTVGRAVRAGAVDVLQFADRLAAGADLGEQALLAGVRLPLHRRTSTVDSGPRLPAAEAEASYPVPALEGRGWK